MWRRLSRESQQVGTVCRPVILVRGVVVALQRSVGVMAARCGVGWQKVAVAGAAKVCTYGGELLYRKWYGMYGRGRDARAVFTAACATR